MKQAILRGISFSGDIPFSSRRLFNALISAASDLQLDLHGIADGLRVSSLIPSKKGELYVPMLKCSYFLGKYYDISNISNRKLLDKNHFIPYSMLVHQNFDELPGLSNSETTDTPPYTVERSNSETTDTPLYTVESIIRNSIPRVAGETLLYNEHKVFCNEMSFLFESERDIKPLLSYLKDSGIGANRGIDGGFDDFEMRDFEAGINGEPNAFISVSRVIPNESDLQLIGNARSYYDMSRERGVTLYGGKPYAYPPVWFLHEGSVTKDKLEGRNINIPFNSMSLYVYGKALCLGIRVKE